MSYVVRVVGGPSLGVFLNLRCGGSYRVKSIGNGSAKQQMPPQEHVFGESNINVCIGIIEFKTFILYVLFHDDYCMPISEIYFDIHIYVSFINQLTFFYNFLLFYPFVIITIIWCEQMIKYVLVVEKIAIMVQLYLQINF